MCVTNNWMLVFWLMAGVGVINCNESNLDLCEDQQACSVVHNRYWMPNKIDKLCVCPPNLLCPPAYGQDGQSIHINSRSQLKFCSRIPETIQPCHDNQTAITLSYRNGLTWPPVTHVQCLCGNVMYLKYHSKVMHRREQLSVYNYKCIAMPMCESNDFCGFVRSDYGFVYQRCTCPPHHNCVPDGDVMLINSGVHELFYTDSAYPAKCIAYSNG